MSWKLDKEVDHWDIYKPQLQRFWNDVKTFNWKEIHHSYTNLFVEKNRWFPYTTGHMEAITFPFKTVAVVYFGYELINFLF